MLEELLSHLSIITVTAIILLPALMLGMVVGTLILHVVGILSSTLLWLTGMSLWYWS